MLCVRCIVSISSSVFVVVIVIVISGEVVIGSMFMLLM